MRNGAAAEAKRFRSCLGALFGIAFTSWVAHVFLGATADTPLLVAPMGASAVLLFAVPESPLAQPWSIIGGNIVAAVVGVACAKLIGTPVFAAATAVALAISVMLALRCVHPPSGAVALTAVLGGPAIHELGYRFVLVPIALQSSALLTAALVFHLWSGHRYPHARGAGVVALRSLWQRMASSLSRERFRDDAAADAALAGTQPAAFEWLQNDVHQHVRPHGFNELTCADIMSPVARPTLPDKHAFVCAVGCGTPISELAPHFKHHACERIAVTDESGRLVGTINQLDLIWGLYCQMRSPQRAAA